MEISAKMEKTTEPGNTYFVEYRIEGRYTAAVHSQTGNLDEIKKKAEEKYWDADFGELEDIGDTGGTYQISVQDENGNFLWEKP